MSYLSDFEHTKLDAHVFPGMVVETRYVSDAATGQRRVPQTRIWNVEKSLGKGGFGEVRLERCNEERRAVKRIWETGSTFKVQYERELNALLEFSKPKYKESAVFVGFLGWFQDTDSVYLAMEYVPLGDLEDNVVKMGGRIQELEVKQIAVQILEGLKIMHLESFVHRDLKPKNVLVCRVSPNWWVKLADFGLSKRRTEDTALRTQTGTQAYMAPELLNYIPGNSEYTYAVDMWALGCIVYRLITGVVPFPPGLSLASFCGDESKFPFQALHMSDRGKECTRKLINAHPSERPTSTEALEHSWLKPELMTADESLGEVIASKNDNANAALELVGNFSPDTLAGLRSYERGSSAPIVAHPTSSSRPKPPSIRYCRPTVEDETEPDPRAMRFSEEVETQSRQAEDCVTPGSFRDKEEELIADDLTFVSPQSNSMAHDSIYAVTSSMPQRKGDETGKGHKRGHYSYPFRGKPREKSFESTPANRPRANIRESPYRERYHNYQDGYESSDGRSVSWEDVLTDELPEAETGADLQEILGGAHREELGTGTNALGRLRRRKLLTRFNVEKWAAAPDILDREEPRRRSKKVRFEQLPLTVDNLRDHDDRFYLSATSSASSTRAVNNGEKPHSLRIFSYPPPAKHTVDVKNGEVSFYADEHGFISRVPQPEREVPETREYLPNKHFARPATPSKYKSGGEPKEKRSRHPRSRSYYQTFDEDEEVFRRPSMRIQKSEPKRSRNRSSSSSEQTMDSLVLPVRRRAAPAWNNQELKEKGDEKNRDPGDFPRSAVPRRNAPQNVFLAPPPTAIEKLEAISSYFHIKILPECEHFMLNPPRDKRKRDAKFEKLSEAIVDDVLRAVVRVEPEAGEAREKRRSLVREVQEVLIRLNAIFD